MVVVHSRNGVPVRFTEERWNHITARHPEIAGHREQVLETLAEPDMIQTGDFGELLAVRAFEGLKLGRFLVVVYRETGPSDGFILTAYLAGRVSSRRNVVWKR